MRHVGKVALIAGVMAAAFCAGFTWKDVRVGQAPSTTALSRLLSGRIDSGTTPTQLFRDNYDLILARYDKPVDPAKLKYAAMQGLFASLGDPPTVFLPPQDAKNFDIDTKGNYAGIGARLGSHALGVYVASVFKNGPADRAGMRAGDVIVKIDGKDVAGKSPDDIVDRVRGGEGTPIVLTVVRQGEEKPLDLRVMRANVMIPTAEGKMVGETGIGLITIDQFSEITAEQFDAALFDLLDHKPRGLVIDLRGNPGGLLDVTVSMLERFLEDKVVVTMRNRSGNVETTRVGSGRLAGFSGPIVILMDKDTASASEIFAGTLRDYQRATLVGDHSYGKASVQAVILLKDMSTAKITIAKYFLPGGENFSRKVDEDGMFLSGGLQPDFLVTLESDAQFARGNPALDSQMRKAIEVIDAKTKN